MVKIGGAGRHMVALAFTGETDKIVTRFKIDKAEQYIYMASVTFPKLAILTLYMRIFSTRVYRNLAYGTGAVIVATCVAGMISSSVICRPFAYNWNKGIPGTCGDVKASYRYIGIPGIITDVVMVVLPLPALYRLQVATHMKIGLLATFIAGGFGLVTSILRTATFFEEDLFKDPTYNCVRTITWTIVEPSVYLMAACMPSFRALKRRF
ncbi:hypothetical protein K491DRAFT_634041, partial [Lophiostoma macrostomum CBS 122681]